MISFVKYLFELDDDMKALQRSIESGAKRFGRKLEQDPEFNKNKALKTLKKVSPPSKTSRENWNNSSENPNSDNTAQEDLETASDREEVMKALRTNPDSVPHLTKPDPEARKRIMKMLQREREEKQDPGTFTKPLKKMIDATRQ